MLLLYLTKYLFWQTLSLQKLFYSQVVQAESMFTSQVSFVVHM